MTKKLDNFFRENLSKILLLMVSYLFLSKLTEYPPYLNLIFSDSGILFGIIALLSIMLFKFSTNFYAFLGVGLSVFGAVFLIFGSDRIAQICGKIIFAIIILIFINDFWSFIKDINKNE